MPTSNAQLFEEFVATWCAGWFVNVAENWTFYSKLYESVAKTFCIEPCAYIYVCIRIYIVPSLVTFLLNK